VVVELPGKYRFQVDDETLGRPDTPDVGVVAWFGWVVTGSVEEDAHERRCSIHNEEATGGCV
jgi:hypothetical protein